MLLQFLCDVTNVHCSIDFKAPRATVRKRWRSGCSLGDHPHTPTVSNTTHDDHSAREYCATADSLCAVRLSLCCASLCCALPSASLPRPFGATNVGHPQPPRRGIGTRHVCTVFIHGLPSVAHAVPASLAAAFMQQLASRPVAAAPPPKRSHHANEVRETSAPKVPRSSV